MLAGLTVYTLSTVSPQLSHFKILVPSGVNVAFTSLTTEYACAPFASVIVVVEWPQSVQMLVTEPCV